MRRTAIAIGALFFSLTSWAATPEKATAGAKIEEGTQYTVLAKYLSPEKEVTEFFSFNCPSCYRFEQEFKGPETIANNLPQGVTFNKYHLDNFGPLAPELSEAWAIATFLDIRKDVANALYNGIQVARNIKSADDIKAVFAKLGVDSAQYDKLKSNFQVKAFLNQQKASMEELRPQSIPTIVVNGKYVIRAQGLDASTNEATINDFSRVANYLLNVK